MHTFKKARPKLSICIATYNRAKFIGETLDSILVQIEPGVELLVVDGASPDNTPEVMAQYLLLHPEIRYFREPVNSGIDGDYDKAVGYAKGEYCWLMSDDDLLKPSAIQHVLKAIDGKSDLIVVNSEIWNADFSDKLLDRRLEITTDIVYGKKDTEQFFINTADHLSFIGGVVIKRGFWLYRDRTSFYGTMFVHVGVIFQKPTIQSVKAIAEPLIAIRFGNATWSARTFEIWAIKWPELIWSFPSFSDTAKRTVCPREQWQEFKFMFFHRAMGNYSIAEFHKFLSPKAKGLAWVMAYSMALFPRKAADYILSLYRLLFKRIYRVKLFNMLDRRYMPKVSKIFANIFKLNILNKK